MTIDQLLSRLYTYQGAIIIYFAVIPVVVFILGFMHSVYGGRRSPWNALYALLLYLVSVPTACLLAASGYVVLMQGVSVMELPFVPTYVPVISFLLTTLLVKRAVDFYYVPALLNPLGLLLLMIAALAGGLYVYYTEPIILLGSKLLTLGAAAILPFLVLRSILGAIFGRRE